jgi:hypothetical protein
VNPAAGTSHDLVVLVADKDMSATFEGLLDRRQSLGLRRIRAKILVHPERDPGCFLRGPDILRSLRDDYSYALIAFDREGCGQEDLGRAVLEADLERRLAENGWAQRAAAVCVDPELENWVWSDSPHVAQVLGWTDATTPLRDWLRDKGYWTSKRGKPSRPKEAVERVLRHVRKPRSSALYRRLASCVGLQRCDDPAFLRLKRILSAWFPESGSL